MGGPFWCGGVSERGGGQREETAREAPREAAQSSNGQRAASTAHKKRVATGPPATALGLDGVHPAWSRRAVARGREAPRALDLDDDVERRRVASVVRRRRGVVDGRVRLLDGVAIEAQLRGARAARVAAHASARPFLLIDYIREAELPAGRLPHKR